MRISELAERTGVSTRLLRYYEERGLLTPRRCANGYRDYAENAAELVAEIRELLAAGLSTRVIRELEPRAPSEINEPRPCPEALDVLRRELGALDARIACLQRVRGNLADYLDGAVGAALAHAPPGGSGSTDAATITRT